LRMLHRLLVVVVILELAVVRLGLLLGAGLG
jgi:hypothetical protein